jgi:D-glycero-alpha-D-manno-heptose-7-phosphate kinase
LNYLEFTSSGVSVRPIDLPHDVTSRLEDRLMLFFTGRSRNSAQILSEQKRGSERNRGSVIRSLHTIKQAAIELREELARGNIESVGECLDRSWSAKRQLAPGISDPWIDQWYEAARGAGAEGGKIAGAGGGGFLVLYCEPERQERVTATLQTFGLNAMDFRFETGGAMVLVNTMYAKAMSALRQ